MELILKKGEEKRILSGESLVFANEILEIRNKEKNGSFASLYSFDNKFIGKGYINHLSKIILRVITRTDEVDDYAFFLNKIKKANDYRVNLGFKDAYRVIYSDADSMSGLIVDKYGDYLVIEISSLGLDLKRDLIVKALVEIFNPIGIYEKCEMGLREKEGLKDSTGLLYGNVLNEVIIKENGINISVDIINGQKTGYFLDQKENRMIIRNYLKDMEVLDCFSNTGGFSVNAGIVAKKVTAVDISKVATDKVLRNALINNLNNIDVITDDCFNVLKDFKNKGKKFDAVILDPPCFTKSKDKVQEAILGYKRINSLALNIIKEGGLLISSSCTEHVSEEQFLNMLIEAGKSEHKKLSLIEKRTQARDHRIILGIKETKYLKFMILKVESM